MSRLIAVGALLAVAAALFWQERHGYRDDENGRFQATLWRLQQLDTQFNDDVLKVRFALLNNYDDFAENQRQSAEALDTLGTIPGFVGPPARAAIAAEVARYRAQLRSRKELIERFNSQNAVVVNSSRYLPTVLEELGRRGKDGALSETANGLSRALLASQSDAEDGTAQAAADAGLLHDWAARHPQDPLARPALSLEHHARNLIAGRSRLDALTAGLLDLPTAATLAGLEDAYQVEVAAALKRAHWYRLSFYSVCAVLLAVMGYILWSQRGANRVLARRVRERTAQLAHQARELEAARDAAETASKAKSSFLANMSHELRTPLNAILGYAQLLQRDRGLGERQRQAVVTVQRSGEHLLMLITDILDLSKIEAGKLELCPASVDLASFLRGVADIVRIRAEEKAIAFRFEPVGELPRFAEFDEKRLRQVLLNLLGNAVKFTDRGEVVLRVLRLDDAGGHARLRFEVRDTGVGIAHAELETIFQPFEQVGNMQRRAGGTGLGLSITRELVRLMGGAVGVSSVLGEGSCFGFEVQLPVAAAAAAPLDAARPVAGYRGERRRVLVVDDMAANREVLVELLQQAGFEVDQAADGRQALARAEAAPPHLVLMDIRMPVMDGLEATRQLRRLPALQRIPVIGVSAGSAQSDGADCLAAGADAFFTKPVEHARLLQEIGRQLRLEWLHEAVPPPPAAAAEAALVPPPQEDIQALHRLALAGNMRSIRQCADAYAGRDPRLVPFADRLRQLAQGCQSRAILALVESHLEQEVES
ncbi:MAG TPA: DAHL domain-containing protein [Nevskia sp.]|nr:DAHL domain-containing protein [Nevskia sp.]